MTHSVNNVLTAHLSVQISEISEVDALCNYLLSVYSGTRLPIFIEIGAYWTDIEQRPHWHVSSRHGVLRVCVSTK